MADVVFVPLAVLYLAVALAIGAARPPGPRPLLWLAAVAAALVAVDAAHLGYWVTAGIWVVLMVAQGFELALAYRPELHRPGRG